LAAAAVTDATSETEQALSFGVYDPDGHCPQENKLAFAAVFLLGYLSAQRAAREIAGYSSERTAPTC